MAEEGKEGWQRCPGLAATERKRLHDFISDPAMAAIVREMAAEQKFDVTVALLVQIGAALDTFEHDYADGAHHRFIDSVDAILTPYQDAVKAETLAEGLERYFGAGRADAMLPQEDLDPDAKRVLYENLWDLYT